MKIVTLTLGFPVVPLEKEKIAIFVFPSPGARRLSSKQAGLANPLCTSASIVAYFGLPEELPFMRMMFELGIPYCVAASSTADRDEMSETTAFTFVSSS